MDWTGPLLLSFMLMMAAGLAFFAVSGPNPIAPPNRWRSIERAAWLLMYAAVAVPVMWALGRIAGGL